MVPEPIEFVVIILQRFLFFGGIQSHLFFELFGICLDGNGRNLDENVLAVRTDRHDEMLGETADGKMHLLHRPHPVLVSKLNVHRLPNSPVGKLSSLATKSGLPSAGISSVLERFAHFSRLRFLLAAQKSSSDVETGALKNGVLVNLTFDRRRRVEIALTAVGRKKAGAEKASEKVPRWFSGRGRAGRISRLLL